MMHQSIATIDSPEFINLQPLEINPLMSRCEIKVLYIGKNRNQSCITKEVATEMAKTLRGAPIVGYYKTEKEDFADHGQRMILDDEGIKFECMTKPYGFVSPDAEVWFQKFDDTDEFGNVETREYLMTTGYLWTGQYEECKDVVNSGRPHSMELDEENLDGHWATDNKTGMEFFIINDAIFSKLCILGEDVEPCFEGSSITAPEVSKTFTKMDENFKKTLFTMMQDLKFALEGGQRMDIDNKAEETATVESQNPEVEVNTEVETAEASNVEETVTEPTTEETTENAEEKDNEEQSVSAENQDSIEENTQPSQETFAKQDEEKDQEEKEEDNNKEEEKDGEEEEEDEKKKYSLLETQFNELQTSYSDLQAKYQILVDFKNQIENEKKDALIKSFYMLSDEDKADVIANKTNYSLEEIEAKLSVICVRKKVNFDLEEESSKEEQVAEATTFNINNSEATATIPAWIAALKNTRDSRK